MDTNKEIARRDKMIASCKAEISQLKEEIAALTELLDCAAANISMLVEDKGGTCKISKKAVAEALGKYRLHAHTDEDGNYVLCLYTEGKE